MISYVGKSKLIIQIRLLPLPTKTFLILTNIVGFIIWYISRDSHSKNLYLNHDIKM